MKWVVKSLAVSTVGSATQKNSVPSVKKGISSNIGNLTSLFHISSLKDKINAPPSNPDEQHVPKSLQRLAELQNRVKNGDFKRKKKKPRRREMFEQRSNESDRDFLHRVNRECAMIKHEAAFEQKFGVEIQRNAEGEIESVKKRPKDPIQVMIKEARREKKKKKKDEGPRLTKSQKRRAKLLEKKKRKMGEKVDEFDRFQDKIKFGEQVHEPPTLVVPKKVKNNVGAPRVSFFFEREKCRGIIRNVFSLDKRICC